MYCNLCNDSYVGIFGGLCVECDKIRNLQAVYGSTRVLEVLETVLVRDEKKQQLKIQNELKTEAHKLDTAIKTRAQAKLN